MEFLGQLTNAELGATRLIFAGSTFLSDIWGWTSPEGEERDAKRTKPQKSALDRLPVHGYGAWSCRRNAKHHT